MVHVYFAATKPPDKDKPKSENANYTKLRISKSEVHLRRRLSICSPDHCQIIKVFPSLWTEMGFNATECCVFSCLFASPETVLNKSGQHAGTDKPLMSYMLAIWLQVAFAMRNIHKYRLTCFRIILNYSLTSHYNIGLSNLNVAGCAGSPHQGQTGLISLCCMK